MAKPGDLKVHLRAIAPETGRGIFVAEPRIAARDEEMPAPRAGIRGWAEAKFRRVKDRWQHSKGLAATRSRQVWDWLHSRTHPDEALLSQIHSSRSIAVDYPVELTGHAASAAWEALLADGRRRHRIGLAVNAVLAPLSVVLAPLPGPNLVGYWFVYRVLHHWLILVGVKRASRGRIATEFRPAMPQAIERPASGELSERNARGSRGLSSLRR